MAVVVSELFWDKLFAYLSQTVEPCVLEVSDNVVLRTASRLCVEGSCVAVDTGRMGLSVSDGVVGDARLCGTVRENASAVAVVGDAEVVRRISEGVKGVRIGGEKSVGRGEGSEGVEGVGGLGEAGRGVDGLCGNQCVSGDGACESKFVGELKSGTAEGLCVGERVVDGGAGCLPGESKYDRNRRWARERSERKKRRQGKTGFTGAAQGPVKIGQYVAGCVVAEDVDETLKASVRRKWAAKNALEALKAEREFAVLDATSLSDEIRNRRVQIVAATEQNMVRIEKVHATLRAAGDVTDDDETRVRTMVSGQSGKSISPSSSVSEAEVRKLVKENEDLKAKEQAALVKEAQYQKLLRGYGLQVDDIAMEVKSEWTAHADGRLTEQNDKWLVENTAGYVVLNQDQELTPQADGKYRVRIYATGDVQY